MKSVPLPKITPLNLGRRAAPFNDPAWLYELKWDGFRSVCYIQKGECRLVSCKGNAFKSWPDLCSAISRLPVEDAILDGEIVCLDRQGKADFNSLLLRRGQPLYYAFDLLWLDGHDLRWQSLIERKDILRRVLNGCPGEVRYVEHFDGGKGEQFFEVCCRHDLEGVVAKRRDSTYLDGDHETTRLRTGRTLARMADEACSSREQI
jgi:bifunctional non-homologous end joining protein LigD